MSIDPSILRELLRNFNMFIDFATSEEVSDLLKKIKNFLLKDQGGVPNHNEDKNIIGPVLHKIHGRTPPKLALAGLTSSGKSMLLNTLFGIPITTVKRTADTTDCVICVPFKSGLVIYDTPGFGSNETFENIARAFLRIPQIPDAQVSCIPLLHLGQPKISIDPAQANEQYHIDMVIFLLDLSRTTTRHDKSEIKNTILELEKTYGSRLVIAGTHLDSIRDLPEKDNIISSFKTLTNEQMISISSVTGDHLDVLIQRIFQTLPDFVSISTLQEALLEERKINRLKFVVSEASVILARIAFLDDSTNQLHIYILMLYMQICGHYSVDKETWNKLNGDVKQIYNYVATHGRSNKTLERMPRGGWEWFRSRIFRTKFFENTVEFQSVGTKGLAELVPHIYALIYSQAGTGTSQRSNIEVTNAIMSAENSIELLVKKKDENGVTVIAGILNEKLLSLFN